ncbi:MAG: hypothetical protein QM704_24100 [Anaeromyxobacteraceae bacterium]
MTASLLVLALLAAAGDPPRDAGLRLVSAEALGGVYRADYSTVGGRTQGFAAAQLSLGVPLPGPLRLRVDALGGRFGQGEWVGSGALRAYAWLGRFVAGASWGHTELQGGIRSDTFALHGEVEEEPWLRVVGSVGLERKSFGDDLRFWELFLRLYPSDRWFASAGVSYAVSQLKQTRADVVLRGEWTAHRGTSTSLAVYAQYGGNLYTKAALGVVLYLDGLPAAGRDRREALAGARFK